MSGNYYWKLSQEIITGNYHRKLSQEIITGNYHRKLSQEIITENYHRKLSQEIITENYYRKLSASICMYQKIKKDCLTKKLYPIEVGRFLLIDKNFTSCYSGTRSHRRLIFRIMYSYRTYTSILEEEKNLSP